ncbi:hypothetical protein N7456_008994 [Penicillium angulare]|uniref:Uncharacterized protein n=1 Tax=Penicillium angulare TaxID=116970 RepID=A0A9W9K4S8_9EURO|nr:hypothetical protein N7456_008994 [Penicillium angulare]
MNREIPGFYFDPEKKKYFKIQANHAAPAGATYSKDTVKRKRTEHEKQQQKQKLAERVAKEKVRKDSFYHHPLVGGDQEIGSRLPSTTTRQDQQARIYASQIQRERLHRFRPWPKDFTIQDVLRHPQSGVLIASGNHGLQSSVSVCFPDAEKGRWAYDRTMERVLFKEQYRLSSISLSHTGYLLATMDSGADGDSFLAPRRLPTPDETGDYQWPTFFTHPIRIRTTPSLWCSAACPGSDKALFAIGTSEGLHTLEGFGSHWTLSEKPFPTEGNQGFHRKTNSAHAHVNAVEWLSSDVIASGLRNSSVFLHDIRSGGSATRLQHPYPVANIRKIDEHRLVVTGHTSMQMYDIRYAPNGIQSKPRPLSSSHTSTRPYLTFPGYVPNTNSNFDVSPELGLLASASDHGKVQLFSLQNGTQVASPLAEAEYTEPISCVRFDSSEEMDINGPQTPSLMVCSRATVDEWAW